MSYDSARQAGPFLRIAKRCYIPANDRGGSGVKRVNLVEYFELAEALLDARNTLSEASVRGGAAWASMFSLPQRLDSFCREDNGFTTSKRVANELTFAVRTWIDSNLMDHNSPPSFVTGQVNAEFPSWHFAQIVNKITAFKSVFAAECGEVDVYAVGQVSIYKTSALVNFGADIIPLEMHPILPSGVIDEFNSAGRCLAFDLPTACGFHALRALELVMDVYVKSFGVTTKMVSWNDYVKAVQKLIDDPKAKDKPSPKVGAMFDRMRELERNPLMHPRDTLDSIQADMLFKLCAITAMEFVRDMQNRKTKRDEAANDGRGALQHSGPALIEDATAA